MRTSFSGFVGCLLLVPAVAALAADLPADRFGPADLARLAAVDEPAFAPDGKSIVYTVTVTNATEDQQQSDLWRVGYDGQDRTQVTSTPKHDEWAPAWSPDGRWLGRC
jgi:dipeptidyl aminopeptidase/acylaminoacyl peptidase